MPDIKDAPALIDMSAVTNAMATVADGLLGQGFNVLVPAWESSCLLKVTNAPGALSELTIAANGSVTWEYRCLDGQQHDGAQLVGLVLGLLGGEIPGRPEPTARLHPPASPQCAIGTLLTGSGMQVTSAVLDSADGFAEITVTNPARPCRGTVRLATGGAVWWEFQLRGRSAVAEGIDLPEIVATIARVLSRLQGDRRCAA
jgi:hypothetical protein